MSIRLATTLLLTAAALVLAAPPKQSKGDAAAGKALYEKTCKACHAGGDGNPAIAKALKVTLRPLSSPEVQAKNNDDLRKSILGEYGKKKPLKGLSDEQLQNVIAHLRTLAKK
jgi:mono/diheme cytochrome c family protein